jgi:hypothetical protein
MCSNTGTHRDWWEGHERSVKLKSAAFWVLWSCTSGAAGRSEEHIDSIFRVEKQVNQETNRNMRHDQLSLACRLLLLIYCLAYSVFDFEDGGKTFLRNIGLFPNYDEVLPRWLYSLKDTNNYFPNFIVWHDRLCGLVVRVLGYRSGGPGSILGTIKKSNGSGTGSTQPREYNWGATW